MSEYVFLSSAQEKSTAFAEGKLNSPWDIFEYATTLVLARWTALRMALEGEWGGGDTRRKAEILNEEILTLFKYNKTIYADDLAMNITEYVEEQFGLVCEDHSIEDISELLVSLADECKAGNYNRVKELHENVQNMMPIDLKKAKLRSEEMQEEEEGGEDEGMEEEKAEPEVDEDGFTTVRRSTRKKRQPKRYDVAAEFPGAQ